MLCGIYVGIVELYFSLSYVGLFIAIVPGPALNPHFSAVVIMV